MPAPQSPSPKPPDAARPAADVRNPILVVVGFVSFVAIVTLMSVAADLTRTSDARLARLEMDVSALKDVVMKKDASSAPATRIFSNFGYRFDLPSGWHADLTGNGAVFFDEAGAPLAKLSCPPLETGYEVWKFEETKRETTDLAGRAHEFRLLLGTPDVELFGDLNILFLSRKGERPEDWQASCQLINWSAVGASDEDFKRIYASAGLE